MVTKKMVLATSPCYPKKERVRERREINSSLLPPIAMQSRLGRCVKHQGWDRLVHLLLLELEVTVEKAGHDTDVDPHEVVGLVHVVSSHVHPHVSDHDVLDAADHGVREGRHQRLAEGHGVHQHGPHHARQPEVEEEAGLRPPRVLVRGGDVSRSSGKGEGRDQCHQAVVVHQLHVAHVSIELLLNVQGVNGRHEVVQSDV